MTMDIETEGVNFWRNGFRACPDCGGCLFLEGPHGGLSVNFKCKNCGSEFNDMGPFGVERISPIQKLITESTK